MSRASIPRSNLNGSGIQDSFFSFTPIPASVNICNFVLPLRTSDQPSCGRSARNAAIAPIAPPLNSPSRYMSARSDTARLDLFHERPHQRVRGHERARLREQLVDASERRWLSAYRADDFHAF